eukprot:TRINITY_DN66937_c0_g1_i1.p1 TRINITY_DN66937_c0_g1~~TRINITY_DN66937_c0_g1_i1.p1  ORF type:complete len:386 (+),score=88.01 TRINITY_DN66937_c0_g1_i1:30-1160(+)
MAETPLTTLDNYRLLGRSGLRVSPLCLGCMTFGQDWQLGSSEEEARQVFDAYYEAGGNFFDTANAYTNGTSEVLLGKFIAERRSNCVVATKYTGNLAALTKQQPAPPGGRYANTGGNHRKSLVESLDGSLKRMGLDYIDLMYVHIYEYRTPIEEWLRALDDCVRAGKILYIGVSDIPAWVASSAQTSALLRGWTPIVALQTRYNLIERSFEGDLAPMALSTGMGVIPWGSLAEGFLTGKYNRDELEKSLASEGKRGSGMLQSTTKVDKNWEIVAKVKEIAAEVGKTPAQVALNWILQKPAISSPLVGARTVAQVKENIQALSFTLTKEQLQQLDDVSKPNLGFPHAFVDRTSDSDFFVTGSGTHVERRVGSPFLHF